MNPVNEMAVADSMPSVVFSYLAPDCHRGHERKDSQKKKSVRVVKGSGAGSPNYRRLNESHVGYKVIIDKDTDTLLGAHLVGPQAGELINLFALAMKNGITTRQLKELPWAYPTYSADIKYMLG
ncbi:MAG TPA: NAD(P)/FAD-dependent oxidoreductase [Desulfobacteraceae bacterium]|nr:NAD(P)/FAD-dependent oxidoreductase [Desulfobacteraceae bacterium]